MSQDKITPAYASFAPPSNRMPPPASPLLASTPPTISISLSRTYPLLLFLDRVLSLITWTSDDPWASFLLVCGWVISVLYFEPILKYLAPLLPVLFLWGLIYCKKQINRDISRHPGLDHMVHTLGNVASRTSLLVEPLTTLANNTTPADIPRLALAALSIAPFYALIAARTMKPCTVLLITGVFVLTYHSVYARVTRAVLWRSRSVRRVVVYFTGGSSGTAKSNTSLTTNKISTNSIIRDSKNATRFVFVVYENQRRWLGIGWTGNLLSYERAPWTDEFLNQASPPSTFELPDSSSGLTNATMTSLGLGNMTGNLVWRWRDKVWKLDLTNDGALVVNSRQLVDGDDEGDEGEKDAVSKRRVKPKSTLVADPSPNEGWIYYDNTWKKPATEDSFMKYTRRRRWVRTAELVNEEPNATETFIVGKSEYVDKGATAGNKEKEGSSSESKNIQEEKEVKPKKTLRFEN